MVNSQQVDLVVLIQNITNKKINSDLLAQIKLVSTNPAFTSCNINTSIIMRIQ